MTLQTLDKRLDWKYEKAKKNTQRASKRKCEARAEVQ